jgi:hypothetical protein
MPAIMLNSSHARCEIDPVPGEPKLISPGCARARAISCLADVAGQRRMHRQHQRPGREVRYRREVARLVVGQIPEQARIRNEACLHQQHRMAVGSRPGDEGGTDRAVRARAVLDHDRLADPFIQPLGHGPRHDVGGAAGIEWHHDAHRSGGKCLRPRRRSRREECRQHDRAGGFHRTFSFNVPISKYNFKP